MLRHILFVLNFLPTIYSLPQANQSEAINCIDVATDDPRIQWHCTEGFELTEDEVKLKNDIVLALWGLEEFRLSKRSDLANEVCAGENKWSAGSYHTYKARSAHCAVSGRSPLFSARCGIRRVNGQLVDLHAWNDVYRPGRCPRLTVCHNGQGTNDWGDTGVEDIGCSLLGIQTDHTAHLITADGLGSIKQILIPLSKKAKTAWCSVTQRIPKQKNKAVVHDAGEEILEDGPPAEGHQAHELQASRMYIEVEGEKGVQFGLKGKSWKTSARLYNLPFGPHPKSEEMDVRFCADFGTIAEMGGKTEITMLVYTDSLPRSHPR